MKIFLLFLALLVAPAFAQPTPQSPADAAREERAVQRERYDLRDQRIHGHERYPRWCRGYDRRDYWIERRACEGDRHCRARVNRKAERCGLR
jgi:hypothetical protein